MMKDALLAALMTEEVAVRRWQQIVQVLQKHFACGAVGLLKLESDSLCPVAVAGLAHETLGRCFVLAQHPRLEAIMARGEPVRFPPGSPQPDPYDGLLDNRLGEPVPVHDCMGVRLFLQGKPWGALTLDALSEAAFGPQAVAELARIARVVELVLRVTGLEEDNRSLRVGLMHGDAGEPVSRGSSDGAIIGQSPGLLALLQELEVVAESELTVLLVGETGVGKELFARRLHQASRRHQRALVQVNCAALPEALAESELFGHAKGAFSGANSERIGRIEAADGGTLFLDEVGELPLSVQAKLLRTLQNGEIQRLGTDQPHKVDVRIVAATNRQLQECVRAGSFRADLYHRLAVYPVSIPPLRERGNDVLLLAGRFLEINRARLGVRSLRLSARSELALCAHDWPGNVRELEHVISRAALRALSRPGHRGGMVTLEPEHLDLDLQRMDALVLHPVPVSPSVMPLKVAMDDCQRQLIRHALEQSQGNWAQAARALALDASNLHKLACRLGLKG
jgi:anaerobic nitric oxide reductase transcription regulator